MKMGREKKWRHASTVPFPRERSFCSVKRGKPLQRPKQEIEEKWGLDDNP